VARESRVLLLMIGAVLLILVVVCSPVARASDIFAPDIPDGFGEGASVPEATASAVLNNQLHVGTRRVAGGCQVWSYDGSSWTEIIGDGFGDANNVAVSSMYSTGSDLYVGTENSVTGAEVWELYGGKWTQVN